MFLDVVGTSWVYVSAPTSDAVRRAAEEIQLLRAREHNTGYTFSEADIVAVLARHCGRGGEDGALAAMTAERNT